MDFYSKILIVIGLFIIIFTLGGCEAKEYTITYHAMIVNETADFNYKSGSKLSLFQPEMDGYTFVGWYKDESLTKLFTNKYMPNEDFALYAKFVPIKYIIQFNTNGGSEIESLSLNIYDVITLPTPSKDNYTFAGWYEDDGLRGKFDLTTMQNYDVTVYAKWEPNDFTVSFNTNGGNEVDNITFDYGAKLSLPTPTKEGYKFTGWYEDNSLLSFSCETMPAKDLTLYAKWIPKRYTISFDTNGPNEIDSITLNYDTELILPITEKEGYTFAGWYKDEDLTSSFELTTMPANNITLYAKWILNQYTISFNTNGGIEINSITFEYCSELSFPNPIKDGFDFAGWFTDENFNEKFNLTAMPANNIILYAKWGHTIYFNTNSEYGLDNIILAYGEELLLPTPIKDGYKFMGWYKNESLTEELDLTMPNDNIAVYAKWEFAESEDLIYSLTNNTYKVIGRSGTGNVVAIPRIHNEMPVVGISDYAFCDDTYLETVVFEEGNNITSIGAFAFSNTALKTFDIPHGVTKIETGTFTLAINLTDVTIPNSVTSIGDYAFAGTINLRNITIPNSVTSIGDYAFSTTTMLTSVIFEEGIQLSNIGDYVFSNAMSLTSITIPNGVSSVGNYAFSAAINLTDVTIPNSVTSIGDYAFAGTINLRNITIPNSVRSIGDYAFTAAASLTNITIPNSVTSIGSHAFEETINLVTIEFEEGIQLSSIEDYTFNNAISLESIRIPKSVTSIGNYAFAGTISLRNITIPNGVTSIGSHAFKSTHSLTNITIPCNVSNIESHAFLETSSLIEINVDSSNQYYSSDNGVLYNADKTTLIKYPESKLDDSYIILDSVRDISDYAFSGSKNLSNITISSNVINISEFVFVDTSSLTNIIVDIKNQYYSSDNGVLFNKDKTILIKYPDNKLDDSFKIPYSVTKIGNRAFYKSLNLIKITIPNTVTNIGSYAFAETKLTDIAIPFSVETILGYAFTNSSLTTIHFQVGKLDIIGMGAFSELSNLTSISIPRTVSFIGRNQFSNDINLESIMFNNTKPTRMYHGFFDNLPSNFKIYVPYSSIDDYKSDEGWSEYSSHIYPIK